MEEQDFTNLWWLTQGFVPDETGNWVFYTDHKDLTSRICKIMLRYVDGLAIDIPVIEPLQPISRNRSKSIPVTKLDDLIQTLTGQERARVQGYIEAIIDQR